MNKQAGGLFRPLQLAFGMPSIENAADVVIGREKLVQRLWKKAEGGSVLLLAERRIGKSWTLVLSVAEAPSWAVPVIVRVEDLNSAAEFVWRLNDRFHARELVDEGWLNHIGRWYRKTEDWARKHLQKIQGASIRGVEIPELDFWGDQLEGTIHHATKSEQKPVVMIDELPFFLDKLIKSGHADEAIQLLDKLRYLRQNFPTLRMIVAGSLGMHVVLRKLRAAGYAGHPINDMLPFEVTPLDDEAATDLAGGLLIGSKVSCSDVESVAKEISTASCGVPFYIQHFVSWMRDKPEQEWTPESIPGALDELLDVPSDPAKFSYYEERLKEHYEDDIAAKARVLLDVLSREEEGIDFNLLLNLARHNPKAVTVDPEELRETLKLLRDDHYLVSSNSTWRFKLEIIRKWWYRARGRSAL